MTWYDGHYYLAATTWGDASVGLTMRKARTIQGLKEAEPVQVWQDDTEDRCCNFWAPEFFLLDGPNGLRWYGYFTGGAAGDDFVNTQYMHVIESEGTDPLDAASWEKHPEPVFERADDRGVFGPGHNTFFKSPDGTEDWMAYHANDAESDVCDMGRTPRIQEFTWHDDGTPNFGTPVATDTPLPVPSRDGAERQEAME